MTLNSQNIHIGECHVLNASTYAYSTGGILEAIKDAADKAVATFKSNNEAIKSGNGDNEKLKAGEESEGKVDDLTKLTMEGKLEGKKDVGIEVATTSTSNDAVMSETEDELNTEKKREGKAEYLMCMTKPNIE